METRADRITGILEENGGRMRAAGIRDLLRVFEQLPELATSIVSSTVYIDNKTRDSQGVPKRFRTYGDGDEEHGWISLRVAPKLSDNVAIIIAAPEEQLPQLLKSANEKTREKLREEIKRLTWQQFESNFLETLLEALGFHGVEITQPTRDGGKDAVCIYKRGLVQSEAIVSAKHWKTKDVAAEEVQRLRGIKGHADTGIIVTSSAFSEAAKTEAGPSQNQRSIVLIDIDIIVDTCFMNGIGVRKVDLPTLYNYSGFEDIFDESVQAP